MVDKHSPDWDQVEIWDNGSGGYIGATLLAGGLGTASDPDLSVVRTLVADVDENGRVLSGYLVEFVFEDAQESQFKEYVEQWLAGDFGNKPMLVAEYTVGYASTSAMFYAPGKDPVPVTMRLEQKIGTGKTAATIYFCWVSDHYEIEVCLYYSNRTDCSSRTEIEITCVCVSGCDGDGGGSGGSTGGGSGGNTGGDDDDGDEEEDVTFSFSCDESVTRGKTAGCTVRVEYAEGVDETQHTFSWSSSTGATFSMSAANGSNWQGVATETATITVAVGTDYSEAGTVTVKARENWSFPSLSANAEESSSISYLGVHHVSRVPTTVPSPTAGSGPWQGREMASGLPSVTNSIKVHVDLWGKGSRYYGASSTCDASLTLRLRERVGTVNDTCDTSAGLTAHFNAVYAHEQEHEAGYNKCLASTKALQTIIKIEGTVGSKGTVKAAIQ